MTSEKFDLSKKIKIHFNQPKIGVLPTFIEVEDVKEFIRLLNKQIKEKDRMQVINGNASQEQKDAFIEGENAGIKNTKKMVFDIIKDLAGSQLTKDKEKNGNI